MNILTKWGTAFFGSALIGSGLQQLIQRDFVRLVPAVPSWLPQPAVSALMSGALLVVTGVAVLFEKKRRIAAVVVGSLLLVLLLLFVSSVAGNPWAGYMWTNPCKTLALLGGAILLAAAPTRSVNELSARTGRDNAGGISRLSACLLGLFFVVGGIQHFVYADFVVQLVPSWIPERVFWTYFTGSALIAGGVGMNIRLTARVAATCSGIMVFLWVILLHIPRALAVPHLPGETSAIFEALAISGTAFLIAGSEVRYRAKNAG